MSRIMRDLSVTVGGSPFPLRNECGAALVAVVVIISITLSFHGIQRTTPAAFDLRANLTNKLGITTRPREQVYFLQNSVMAGEPAAMCELASRLYTGSGVNENLKSAIDLWVRASTLGSAEARFCLAILYAKGEAVEQSEVEAYKWLLLSQEGTDEYSKLAMILLTETDKVINPQIRNQAKKLADEYKSSVAKRNLRAGS